MLSAKRRWISSIKNHKTKHILLHPVPSAQVLWRPFQTKHIVRLLCLSISSFHFFLLHIQIFYFRNDFSVFWINLPITFLFLSTLQIYLPSRSSILQLSTAELFQLVSQENPIVCTGGTVKFFSAHLHCKEDDHIILFRSFYSPALVGETSLIRDIVPAMLSTDSFIFYSQWVTAFCMSQNFSLFFYD